MISYTLSAESATVIHKGKSYTVKKGTPNFVGLRQALLDERWDDVPKYLTIEKSLNEWAKGFFTLEGNQFFYKEEALPADLNNRIMAMATSGEDPQSLFNFWERLQKNPSWRSVQQLYTFLEHGNIPITRSGHLLAYKGVTSNFKDAHSGKIDNHPGAINKMPRNKVSDDPNVPCHYGFHVGDLSYARSFSNRTVICMVDPEHVVCVPKDESNRKMRVCEYTVVGNYGTKLPDTLFSDPVVESAISPEPEQTPEVQTEATQEYKEPAPSTAPPDESHKPGKSGIDKKALEAFFSEEEINELEKADVTVLLEQKLENLRKFATYGLKIVGASKVEGGKLALATLIIKTRENQ